MKPAPRRHLLVDPIDEIDVKGLRTKSGIDIDTKLSGRLLVWIACLGPSTDCSVPNPLTVDRSVLVINGSLLQAGMEYGRWSVFFMRSTETIFGLKLGANGAQALVLDYPIAGRENPID